MVLHKLFQVRFLAMVAGILTILSITTLITQGNIRMPWEEEILSTDILVPAIDLPDSVEYVPYTADEIIHTHDNRSIGQMHTVPEDLKGTVTVYFPDIRSMRSDDISFTILSSIRYIGDEYHLTVTTIHPSDAAVQKHLSYGDKEISIGNGMKAWLYQYGSYDTPTQFIIPQNELIIGVTSNAPTHVVKQWLEEIYVQ